MVFDLLRFYFSIGLLTRDDMAYIMNWKYDISGLGGGNGFGKLLGGRPA